MAIKLNLNYNKNANITIKKQSSRDVLYGTGATKTIAAKKIAPPTIPEISTLPSALMDTSITLDADQIAARDGMINEKYSILIGSAGTGKTTTIKALLVNMESSLPHGLSDEGEKTLSIAFCSFMGKAVQQMKRALPKRYHSSCNTIHATLGFKPVQVDYTDENGDLQVKMQFLPDFDENNLLPHDAILIDEIGTVSIPLWHYLLAALKPSCRIIFLGDLNQLVPVAGHSILGFAMLSWPTFELTVLHRNAGPIAENAHRVINGRLPITDTSTAKVVIKTIADGSIGARTDFLGIISYLYKKGKFDPMQDGIIVPQNIDILGQLQLNEVLVNLFNPDAKRIAIKAGSDTVVLAVGDKVMLLKNLNNRGLTNGMQGVITSISANNAFLGSHIKDHAAFANVTMDLKEFESMEVNTNFQEADEIPATERAGSHIVTVKFQDVAEEILFATVGELANITLSYVFTCHKAQGSEYRFVIALCHSANRKMLSREWLYTAMTRAKDNLLILCNKRGLTHAVGTQRIKGVTMQEKVQKFIALTKAAKDEPPAILPEPKTITTTKLTFNIKGNK